VSGHFTVSAKKLGWCRPMHLYRSSLERRLVSSDNRPQLTWVPNQQRLGRYVRKRRELPPGQLIRLVDDQEVEAATR
jgi:hypothetical protein